MNFFKSLAITGGLSLLAVASASASTLAYDQTLGGNGFYAGNGNSAEHFATLTDVDANLQLAIRAGNRYTGTPILIPDGNNYDYNSNPNTDPSKNWGFYYSIDTRNGGGDGTIGDYSYLLIFRDETTATDYTYSPLVNDDSYYDGTGVHGGNGNDTGVAAGPGNEAGNIVAQSTYYGVQNANWGGWFVPAFDPSHVYSITLQATENIVGGQTQNLTITVNGTPEPGTIAMMLGSLGALGLYVRRRKA